MTSDRQLVEDNRPRNLIVCSDGTGNAGGKTRGTNVWRIYNAVERRGNGERLQVASYDDGLGTEDFKLLKMLGGAFGLGFTSNLIDCYSFLALNYDAARGDRIYLFGFSRGAFTVRTLAGIIVKCGLLSRKHFQNATEPRKLVGRIIKAYRRIGALAPAEDTDASRAAEEKASSDLLALQRDHTELSKPVQIHFIGVFDTVDAVGVPNDVLAKGIDYLARKLLGWRLYGFRDRDLSQQVSFGAQALSIDDERKTFHPNVWNENRGEAIQQVWFAGAHSNVGGGYPRDAVSLVPLEWMIEHAEANDLRFVPDALARLSANDGQINWLEEPMRTEGNALARGLSTADSHGQLYNPRKGVGVVYNYAPRELPEQGAKIHASVYDRIVRGTKRYAPRVLPPNAEVAFSEAGPWAEKVVPVPKWTQVDLDRVEKLAGMRTSTYRIFVTVLSVVLLAVVGLTTGALGPVEIEPATGMIWDILRWPIPRVTEPIVNLIPMFPWVSAAVAATFALLLATSSTLRSSIGKTSFAAWRHAIGRLDLAPEEAGAEEAAPDFEERAKAHLSAASWRVWGLRAATAVAVAAAVALAITAGPGPVEPDAQLPPVAAGAPGEPVDLQEDDARD